MILRGGRVLTGEEGGAVDVGDLRIEDGRITAIASDLEPIDSEDVIDCANHVVMPGFVQAHVHLCQTLFRNLADDMPLLEWLRKRIWPFEAWIDAEAMAVSAKLGLYELIAGGTTSILDMGSVRHTDVLFDVAEASGVRYTGGKCLMDLDDGHVPAALLEDADASLAETERLIERYHDSAAGRLRYAIAPRFAVSCSDDLLRRVSNLAYAKNVRIHSHASENVDEVALVKERTGQENIDYLVDMHLLGTQTTLAHCVHLSEHEVNLLFGSGTHVAHCPSSNLKLGSGIAPIPELLEYGINIALGADGAPCNNRLDMFREMHLAALVQKPRLGPDAMSAETVLRLATQGGAAALGLEDDIGTLEVGKKADVIVVDLDGIETSPSFHDVASALVYAAHPGCVRDVIVDGRILKRDGTVLTLDVADVRATAASTWQRLRGDFPNLAPES